MAKVTGLGHVGLYVQDMEAMLRFYTGVLGMTVTDHGMEGRVVFLSARPEDEHHELALGQSDTQKTRATQVSFTVATLEDLRDMYRRIVEYGCAIDSTVNHGIALGCHFRDPEDNRLEVYWPTGIDYPQPFAEPIDLAAPAEDLMRELKALSPRVNAGGHRFGRDTNKPASVASAA